MKIAIEHCPEPSVKFCRVISAPIFGAGVEEAPLLFELEGRRLATGSFDFDLAVDAFVEEPKVGKAGPIIEATGLSAFVDETGDCFEKINDFGLDSFFGGHKKFLSSLLYFWQKTLYNRIVLGNYRLRVFSSAWGGWFPGIAKIL